MRKTESLSSRQKAAVMLMCLGPDSSANVIRHLQEDQVEALFGEMGERLLLEGASVIPKRLQESGYQFRYADLKSALETTLNE